MKNKHANIFNENGFKSFLFDDAEFTEPEPLIDAIIESDNPEFIQYGLSHLYSESVDIPEEKRKLINWQ